MMLFSWSAFFVKSHKISDISDGKNIEQPFALTLILLTLQLINYKVKRYIA